MLPVWPASTRLRSLTRAVNRGCSLVGQRRSRHVLLSQGFLHVFYDARPVSSAQIVLQSAKGDANDVAVMQSRPEFFAQVQPQIVGALHVFRPQTRWVRAEVDEGG